MRALLACVPLVLLTACGTSDATGGPDLPAPEVPKGQVQTQGTGTVMGSGTRATLCNGIEYRDDGCDGIVLSGWDWQAHARDAERIGRTYTGYFHLTGRFDGKQLAVSKVTPLDEYIEPAEQPVDDVAVPCPEPAGGLPRPDLARTSYGDAEAAMTAAEKLPDFASAGGVRLEKPDDGGGPLPRDEVFTVRVSEDLERAERTVRKHWGGMLCVVKARYSAVEVKQIVAELNDSADHVRAVDTADTLELEVDFDDGSVQAWADEEYGPGVVRVRPVLVPS